MSKKWTNKAVDAAEAEWRAQIKAERQDAFLAIVRACDQLRDQSDLLLLQEIAKAMLDRQQRRILKRRALVATL